MISSGVLWRTKTGLPLQVTVIACPSSREDKSTSVEARANVSAAADTLALASTEVDLSSLEEGQAITVTWRGKPVFVRHRTPEEIKLAKEVSLDEMRHPETDEERVHSFLVCFRMSHLI